MLKDPIVIELKKNGYVELPLRGQLSSKTVVVVSSKVTKKYNKLLDMIATQRGITKSDVIRVAIEKYVLPNNQLNRAEIEFASNKLSNYPLSMITVRIDNEPHSRLMSLASHERLHMTDLMRYAIYCLLRDEKVI